MNAVNLLPAKHRPRTPTGGQQGSSYAVIGVLGILLVMVLVFAVTVNGINTKKASVARAQAETAQAKKRAESLAAYGNFIQVKEQRVSSVKQLATGRIDWERLTRSLAHVLPPKVWLTSANASSTGAPEGGEGAAPSGGAPGGPSMVLNGCAPTQADVAVTLVRLRHLPQVADVKLASIQKPDTPTGGGGAAPGAVGAAQQASGAGAGGGGGQDCGTVDKRLAYKFDATVTFKPQEGSTPPAGGEKKVPASLGGGA